MRAPDDVQLIASGGLRLVATTRRRRLCLLAVPLAVSAFVHSSGGGMTLKPVYTAGLGVLVEESE